MSRSIVNHARTIIAVTSWYIQHLESLDLLLRYQFMLKGYVFVESIDDIAFSITKTQIGS